MYACCYDESRTRHSEKEGRVRGAGEGERKTLNACVCDLLGAGEVAAHWAVDVLSERVDKRLSANLRGDTSPQVNRRPGTRLQSSDENGKADDAHKDGCSQRVDDCPVA